MIDLILVILAKVLYFFIEPISLVYVVLIKKHSLKGYLKEYAIAIDRFGNYQYRTLFNHIWIKEKGYQFGDFRETISSVLGKNQRDGTLSKKGEILVSILDFIDKDHCKKSINNF